MDMMQCVAHKEAKKKRKYVDATDMKERFCGNCSHENPCWVCMIFHFFNDFPAADVAEVRHGRWVELPPFKNIYVCSLCEQWGEHHWNYCPNCGAKMDEVEE